MMKIKNGAILLLANAIAVIPLSSLAQSSSASLSEGQSKSALVPVPRTGKIEWRQTQVLQEAKNAPGAYDIEFIGDSITDRFRTIGSKVWNAQYGSRKVINMGVSGDCIENVLWRIENGQLDGITAKVAVLMIGTNNSHMDKSGIAIYPDADILAGITRIVAEIRVRQPQTKVLLLGIFPRAKTFDPWRGRLLQINQALAKLDDGQHIHYLDIGHHFIEKDGSISMAIMADYLHPSEAGYQIWATAMASKMRELLSD